VFFKPFADRSSITLVCIGDRWVSVEELDFAKSNDRNSAAHSLADIPTKLLKQASISLHGRLALAGSEHVF